MLRRKRENSPARAVSKAAKDYVVPLPPLAASPEESAQCSEREWWEHVYARIFISCNSVDTERILMIFVIAHSEFDWWVASLSRISPNKFDVADELRHP